MGKYLLIENKGEIDVNALILMGGSTKRDSASAIGFFGSGNKYSIALFLKNEIPFRIFSGNQELVVSTKEVKFRDKEFKQILINGQETSLTTDMGPQWDSWMGIREWVSNSIDEGESNVVNAIEEINPKEGYTRIYVEHHQDIVNVIEHWNRYFSFDRTDSVLEIGENKMFPQMDTEKESLLLYRKGIQAYHMTAQRALYNYDLSGYKINESRVINDTYTAKSDTCRFLCNNATEQIARYILSNGFVSEKYWEGEMDWYWYGSNKLCQGWKDAIGSKIIINNDASGFYLKEMADHPHYRVSKEMAKAIKGSFPDVVVYGVGQDSGNDLNWRDVESTPKMKYMLKKALEFCNDTDYVVNYPINIVEFDKSEIMGCAHNKNIYIASSTFDMGMKEVVMTLIEENEHIKTGFDDETRAFQTHFIRMFLTTKEEQFGIFL